MRATLDLAHRISEYLFEQECGDLRSFTPAQKKQLEDTLDTLKTILKSNKVKNEHYTTGR
jgi:hypothetical protein